MNYTIAKLVETKKKNGHGLGLGGSAGKIFAFVTIITTKTILSKEIIAYNK